MIASRFKRTLLLRASLLLGCALIGAVQVRAQFSRASILGQVTDSTNAPVPNATVHHHPPRYQ